MRQSNGCRHIALVLALLIVATPGQARRLLETDGIELHGTARVLEYGAGTCHVLEASHTAEEYERIKGNEGKPLDVWQLDFSVYNGSGKALDHLIALYGVESPWPPCTNWSDSYSKPLKWTDTNGHIQRSGKPFSVVPGETLTEEIFIIVFHGDEPRFANWRVNFTFAEGTHATPGVQPPKPQAESKRESTEVAQSPSGTDSGAAQSPAPKSTATTGRSCADWNTEEFFKKADAADVKRCLEAGANPNAQANNGFTPLFHVLNQAPINKNENSDDIVIALLRAGADPNAQYYDGSPTPLYWVDSLSQLEALLNAGADPNAWDREGYSPLLWYVDVGGNSLAQVQRLLKAGAQVNVADSLGETPLHKAVSGNTKLVPILLDSGADVHMVNNQGLTPLHQASNAEAVVALLRAGADVNAGIEQGFTPLDRAVSSRDYHRRGLKLSKEDDEYSRNYHLKRLSGRLGVIQALQAAGARSGRN